MTRKTRAKAILNTCDDLPFGMLGHGYVNLAGDIMCSKKYHYHNYMQGNTFWYCQDD